MKLERHVGGLSQARKVKYLGARGWTEEPEGWRCDRLFAESLPLKRAVHHQLTDDLCRALARSGWKVLGYSPRGYAKLEDPQGKPPCSLPAALRRQAHREKLKVGDLTYSLFLAALLESESPASSAG